MTSEYYHEWEDKNLEGGSSGLFEGAIITFSWTEWEKPWKSSVSQAKFKWVHTEYKSKEALVLVMLNIRVVPPELFLTLPSNIKHFPSIFQKLSLHISMSETFQTFQYLVLHAMY
jgi:hypothetical protein